MFSYLWKSTNQRIVTQSYLVGLNYPANSVGRLPLDFLDAPKSVKSKAIVANARAILEQYHIKEGIYIYLYIFQI